MFRRKQRCQNLCPSPHPSYRGRQCILEPHEDGMCKAKVGPYYHYWNQDYYEQRGLALKKGEPNVSSG